MHLDLALVRYAYILFFLLLDHSICFRICRATFRERYSVVQSLRSTPAAIAATLNCWRLWEHTYTFKSSSASLLIALDMRTQTNSQCRTTCRINIVDYETFP